MKQAKKAFCCAILVCAAAALFAGCSVFGYAADDNFPYDVAAKNGYSGSEAEWLTAQEVPETVYRRMYEEAKTDGSFTGTYFEFLKELGLEADATPYIQRALLSVVSVSAKFISGSNTVLSSGAGVIYQLDKAAGDAYIVTNYHVLYSSTQSKISSDISVYLYGNKTTEGAIAATYYGGTMDYDLAVLRVQGSEILKGSDACAVTLGAAHSAVTGETIYAIGNPLNRDISVTSGVVSVEEEWVTLKAADEKNYNTLPEIRIDAAINHGNSGGGLFNAAGELIGIVNARNGSEDVSGFGYAIPLELAEAITENILGGGGKLTRLHDGLIVEVEASRAVYDGETGRTHISQKICVSGFNSGAGATMGIRQGDTLISGTILRDGEKIAETQFTHRCAFEAFTFMVRPGDTVRLTVSRAANEVTLQGTFSSPIYFEEPA